MPAKPWKNASASIVLWYSSSEAKIFAAFCTEASRPAVPRPFAESILSEEHPTRQIKKNPLVRDSPRGIAPKYDMEKHLHFMRHDSYYGWILAVGLGHRHKMRHLPCHSRAQCGWCYPSISYQCWLFILSGEAISICNREFHAVSI